MASSPNNRIPDDDQRERARATFASARAPLTGSSIRSNRGFQIRKVPKITVEQERDLRDQLHHEIEQKTKACSNFVYDCSLPRVDGYEFCLKHILQDPKAPYKQCSYAYPRSNKRCQQPAPKRDVYTSLCFEHSRQTQLQLTRSKFGTFRNVETNETLLRDLAHRIDTERSAAAATNKYVDPFGPSARVLNYASDDSDAEPANGGGVATADPEADDVDVLDGGVAAPVAWTGQDMDQSDNESVDSQNEDFLKHAGIYTTEEATVITKSKMVRLQTLYSEQIYRLHHLLRQKRRSCVQNLRVERDSLANNTSTEKADISAVPGVNAAGASAANAAVVVQPRKTQKQKALNQYLKKHGVEAVLQHKAAERRAAAVGSTASKLPSQQQHATGLATQSPINRCVFSEGGVKCGERGIPLTKYCRKHILEDRAQVLFKACGIEKSGVQCQEPVPITFENATCVLHFELPPQRAYTQKKYDSDEGSDDDDEVVAITTSSPAAAIHTAAGTVPPTVNAERSSSASSKRNTTEKFDDTQEQLDTYPAASYVEQSADAMSPLCVSPMDMESDTDVAAKG